MASSIPLLPLDRPGAGAVWRGRPFGPEATSDASRGRHVSRPARRTRGWLLRLGGIEIELRLRRAHPGGREGADLRSAAAAVPAGQHAPAAAHRGRRPALDRSHLGGVPESLVERLAARADAASSPRTVRAIAPRGWTGRTRRRSRFAAGGQPTARELVESVAGDRGLPPCRRRSNPGQGGRQPLLSRGAGPHRRSSTGRRRAPSRTRSRA